MKDKRKRLVEIIKSTFCKETYGVDEYKIADAILTWHESEVEKRRLTVEEMMDIACLKMSQMCLDNPSDRLGYKPSDIIAQGIFAAQERKGK